MVAAAYHRAREGIHAHVRFLTCVREEPSPSYRPPLPSLPSLMLPDFKSGVAVWESVDDPGMRYPAFPYCAFTRLPSVSFNVDQPFSFQRFIAHDRSNCVRKRDAEGSVNRRTSVEFYW